MRPYLPTRLGPIRFCTQADTLRSRRTRYSAPPRMPPMTTMMVIRVYQMLKPFMSSHQPGFNGPPRTRLGRRDLEIGGRNRESRGPAPPSEKEREPGRGAPASRETPGHQAERHAEDECPSEGTGPNRRD